MRREIKFCDLTLINAPYHNAFMQSSRNILDSGRFIGGKEVEDFEQMLSEMTGTQRAIGVGNGYDALKLIFKAFIINGYLKKGDKVLIPANTYIASVNAVVNAGLTPVPVDVDPARMVISADTILQKLDTDIKAIMPVHLYGRIVWDQDIKEICRRNNLIVIEDNAQAIGAVSSVTGIKSDSKMSGALGHAAAFSFYPTKNIGALGDGGAVTTDMKDIAATVKELGCYGENSRFHNVIVGENSRLDSLQASFLRCKLPDVSEINERRRMNAVTLSKKISSSLVVLPPTGSTDSSMVWHQYVVRIKYGKRDSVREILKQEGIETDIHYPALPFLQPCFGDAYKEQLKGMNALSLPDEILSLPVNQTLDEDDMNYIAETINSINL